MRDEIVNFVSSYPGASAQAIVAHLSVDLGMRNHGLTPRKVGFFIPRYCPELTWYQDHVAGRRVYTAIGSNLAQNKAADIQDYAQKRTGSHTPVPMSSLRGLADRASIAGREMAGARAASEPGPSISSRATSMARSGRSRTGVSSEA